MVIIYYCDAGSYSQHCNDALRSCKNDILLQITEIYALCLTGLDWSEDSGEDDYEDFEAMSPSRLCGRLQEGPMQDQ